jgi:hypothetical protein
MEERIEKELELLRQYYPDLEYRENGGRWVRIPDYRLRAGWNREATDVAFQIKPGHPTAEPYGIYVPAGLQYEGQDPDRMNKSPSPTPPFEGTWWLLSWAPEKGEWRPTANLVTGSNLHNWVRGFRQRFEQGR